MTDEEALRRMNQAKVTEALLARTGGPVLRQEYQPPQVVQQGYNKLMQPPQSGLQNFADYLQMIQLYGGLK
jgi:hypothetical protein